MSNSLSNFNSQANSTNLMDLPDSISKRVKNEDVGAKTRDNFLNSN